MHHDQQGSIRAIVNAKGEMEAAYTFNPFGSLNSSSGANNSLLRYDDEYTSTDNGLIYLRARTYDPKTAQFLSVDPALPTSDDPYARSGAAPTQLHYAGQYTSGTGLIDLSAGMSGPNVTQFYTIDPALQVTDEPYAYAADNPLNFADPTGRGWLTDLRWAATSVAAGALVVAAGAVVVGILVPVTIPVAAVVVPTAVGVAAVAGVGAAGIAIYQYFTE